jgi:hypothetical protein
MKGNTMAFDPFGGHRSKPEPDQAQPVTELSAAEPASTETVVEPWPAAPIAKPFDHLKTELEPERPRVIPSAQRLLIWIQRDWRKPTISLRDILAYGPAAIRDRQLALERIEILVQHGWLILLSHISFTNCY